MSNQKLSYIVMSNIVLRCSAFLSSLVKIGLDNGKNLHYALFIKSMSPRIYGLVQEIRNSIANALELRLSCTNQSIYRERTATFAYKGLLENTTGQTVTDWTPFR